MQRSRSTRARALAVITITALLATGCGLFSRRGDAGAGPGSATADLTLAPGFGEAATVSGSAQGSRAAGSLRDGCAGSIGDAPSIVLHAEQDFAELEIVARSSVDTTLVVQHPDGTYSCDDDSGGSRNPRIARAFAAGEHRVWVGTYRAGGRADFTVSIAEGAGTAREAPQIAGPYHGTVTVENRLASPVCRVETDDGPAYVDHALRIDSGAQGTFELAQSLHSIWVIGCDGRVLFGGPNPSLTTPGTSSLGELQVGTLVLAESAPSDAPPSARILVAEPRTAGEYLEGVLNGLVRSYSDAMNDRRPLRAEAFAALVEGGRARRWPETFVALRLVSSDWETIRHRNTGVILRRAMTGVAIARFPSGLCQATPVSFVQEHDGRDFEGPIRFGDIGGNHRVPCAIAEAAAEASDWAH